jgi:hypothetical protein
MLHAFSQGKEKIYSLEALQVKFPTDTSMKEFANTIMSNDVEVPALLA